MKHDNGQNGKITPGGLALETGYNSDANIPNIQEVLRDGHIILLAKDDGTSTHVVSDFLVDGESEVPNERVHYD